MTAESDPIELSRWRDSGGLVRINHAQLVGKMHLRGKPLGALRKAGVSYDTIAKIRRGELVSARILRKIVIALDQMPELEHAADLLAP